jgi:hypothetical protein
MQASARQPSAVCASRINSTHGRRSGTLISLPLCPPDRLNFFSQDQQCRRFGQRFLHALQVPLQLPDAFLFFLRLCLLASRLLRRACIGCHSGGAPCCDLLSEQPLASTILGQFDGIQRSRLQHHRELVSRGPCISIFPITCHRCP